MGYRRALNITSLLLLVIGGFNWGLVALAGFDPLAPILGGYNSLLTRIIYAAVGLSAVWVVYAYLMTPGEDFTNDKDI